MMIVTMKSFAEKFYGNAAEIVAVVDDDYYDNNNE